MMSTELTLEHVVPPTNSRESLEQLGLTPDMLWEVVLSGISYARQFTSHDPTSVKGIATWGRITRLLRDTLVPYGWRVENEKGYALTVHPSGNWAIVVARGNGDTTSIGDSFPTNRSPKGPMTRLAVYQNSQMHFLDIDPDNWRSPHSNGRRTWMLLYSWDQRIEEISVELALPLLMDEVGHVVRWEKRIQIPDPSDLGDTEGEETFDVKVEWKD